jgi:hypothetical protein
MKATDRPQFSRKWWTTEKPADIKGADLEKALAAAERALAEEKKRSEQASIDACLVALKDVESAVEKTIKRECDRKKHKDAIAVLDKYASLVEADTRRLEKLLEKATSRLAEAPTRRLEKLLEKATSRDNVQDAEDEESDDKIFQPDHLYKMMKILRSTGKELNFGFGLDAKNPSASKLLLTRKGNPERLFKALKSTGDFSNRLLTYGKAMPDVQDGKTLVFKLAESAGEPPQIQKLGRQFLRADRNLKFRKLKLVLPGGQTLEDTEPDTEEAEAESRDAARAGDLARELAAVERLAAAWRQALSDVTSQINQLRKAVEQDGNPALHGIADGLGKVINDLPDLDLSRLAAAAKANDRAAYDRTLVQTGREVRQVYEMLAEGPLLSTIDENPFIRTNVQSTIRAVLERVSTELAMRS